MLWNHQPLIVLARVSLLMIFGLSLSLSVSFSSINSMAQSNEFHLHSLFFNRIIVCMKGRHSSTGLQWKDPKGSREARLGGGEPWNLAFQGQTKHAETRSYLYVFT